MANINKVYFIRAGDFIKIGTTNGPVKARLSSLQTASPIKLEIVGVMFGGVLLEKNLHTQFDNLRAEGEWFRYEASIKSFIVTYAVTDPEVINHINVDKDGLREKLKSIEEQNTSLKKMDTVLKFDVECLCDSLKEAVKKFAILFDKYDNYCFDKLGYGDSTRSIYFKEARSIIGNAINCDWRTSEKILYECKDPKIDRTIDYAIVKTLESATAEDRQEIFSKLGAK